MSIAKKLGYSIWAALMFALLVQSEWSSANNFKETAEKTGCKSILTRNEQEACDRVQGEKNTVCNVRTDCEPDKQERAIKEYETAIERLKTIPPGARDRRLGNEVRARAVRGGAWRRGRCRRAP